MTDTAEHALFPAEPPAKKYLFLNLKQRIAITEALRGVLTDIGPELVEFLPGHTDKTVASSMPFTCNSDHVQAVRREMYGRLYARGKNKPVSEPIRARLGALEERVNHLEMLLGASRAGPR